MKFDVSRHTAGIILPVAVLLFFFCRPAAVHADTVTLSDGQVLEGYYLGDVGDAIRFRAEGTIREIKRADVVRIAIGYGGVPVCYRLRAAPDVRKCDARLRSLDARELVIAAGKGFTESQTMALRDFLSVEFSRKDPGEKLVPTLKAGSRLSLTLADERQVIVTVLASEQNRLKITDASGGTMDITEEQIVKAALSVPPPAFLWSSLIPGLPQYRRGERTRSLVFAAGVGLCFLGAILEEGAARRDARASAHDFLYNSTGLSSRSASFQGHRRNAQIFLAAGAGIYGFHLRDAFFHPGRSNHAEGRLTLQYSLAVW